MAAYEYVDITPTPRVLRILGEIPFQPWQCIAELADNSIDAFIKAESDKLVLKNPEINITWSGNNVALAERTIEVSDNAQGMTLEQMQNAVRAGYTSNDPVNNLGLFGMGFNIATARLGAVTEIMTARLEDDEWVGLRLDYDELMSSKKYDVPVFRRAKLSKGEHGTQITVSKLKSGILNVLSTKEKEIRTTLQRIYSPLLADKNIKIRVKGKMLTAMKPCVWDEKRYVIHDHQQVHAIQKIDCSLGASYFDVSRNSYLTDDESDEVEYGLQKGIGLPKNIVKRERHIWGWVGIQRYANPDDYGIDFIRNGRKILLSDKSFFQFDNPYTGIKETQYPTELGSTIGGRIIGELHVDFLIPTYQKNDFDRTDRSWQLLADYVCGSGPYRPKMRKAMGFTEPITAPIPLLVNAYSRVDKGTKCLFVASATAKEFLKYYREGKPEYQNDELWYKAAQEADQERASGGSKSTTEVDSGDTLTDDLDSYFDNGTDTSKGSEKPASFKPTGGKVKPVLVTTKKEDLISASDEIVTLSGKYNFDMVAPYEVTTYELKIGDIKVNGEIKPTLFENDGIHCTYIYNPRHEIFRQYSLTPKALLLYYLAEKIKARDPANHSDIVEVYTKLVQARMPEAKVDRAALQEKADVFWNMLRERILSAFAQDPMSAVNCIHESLGDVEETMTAMISGMTADTTVIQAFQNKEASSYIAIEFVPARTLIRLIDNYPERVFDGNVFNTMYMGFSLADEKATDRMRYEAKDRMISYLKDAARLQSSTSKMGKNELSRIQISLEFLEEAIV